MAQMQTRFRRVGIASCGSAVSTLRLTEIAHLLARMTIFHPDRQIIRVAVEDPAVKIGSAPPLSRFKCAIGIVRQGDLAALAPETQHRYSTGFAKIAERPRIAAPVVTTRLSMVKKSTLGDGDGLPNHVGA